MCCKVLPPSEQHSSTLEATPTHEGTRLWEDRALAGFIHLRPSLSTRETFAILDARRMTSKVKMKELLF